jgi:hypothetical protein
VDSLVTAGDERTDDVGSGIGNAAFRQRRNQLHASFVHFDLIRLAEVKIELSVYSSIGLSRFSKAWMTLGKWSVGLIGDMLYHTVCTKHWALSWLSSRCIKIHIKCSIISMVFHSGDQFHHDDQD